MKYVQKIKTPERRQWCRSGVFIVHFKHISHFALVFLLLTLTGKCRLGNVLTIINLKCLSVSIKIEKNYLEQAFCISLLN